MRTHSPRILGRQRRGGYLYLAVMATALIVSAIGLAALSVASLNVRTASNSNDWCEAELLAHAAIERALLQISNQSVWRTSYTNNLEYPTGGQSLGNGRFSFKLVDDDGNLSDDDSDSVQLFGIGRVRDATVVNSVRLLPTGAPLACLKASLQCQGAITVGSGVELFTDQVISSNSNINASAFLARITGNAEAVGTISGSISGTQTSGVALRRMPGSGVFDYYKDNATWIELASIPKSNGNWTIEKTVLSPAHNPYGSTNTEGIYVIDCQNNRIDVKDCRILGTLVLLNLRSDSRIEGSIRWDAAVANYPALLVDGDIEIRFHTGDLNEANLGVNFNPMGAPYLGNQDIDATDTYPSELNGVIYVSGIMNLPADLLESNFRGSVICGSIAANSKSRFNYRAIFHDAPPPGFASGNPMVLSPGSWRRQSLTP